MKLLKQVRALLAGRHVLYVDYTYAGTNRNIISGWVLDRKSTASRELTVKAGTQKLNFSIHIYDREDVASSYRVTKSQVFGFVISCDNNLKNIKDILILWGGKKFKLSDSHPQEFLSVTHLKSKLPECPDEFINSAGAKFELADNDHSVNPALKTQDKDLLKVINLLASVKPDRENFIAKLKNETVPSIHKIWTKRLARYADPEIQLFGKQVSNPVVSIVIPLYGRYDFIQYQVAHFSCDISMKDTEIVYVLDAPHHKEEVVHLAERVSKTFCCPLKLIISMENRGFSGANNLAAKYCQSDLLLFLNSDVVPKSRNWLTLLIAQYQEAKTPCILGATLLYEDDTIQHAGMQFKADLQFPDLRVNHHPHKGLPLDLVKRKGVFQVDAVTGACMIIAKELYTEVDGFDEMHILGDYEDSDLCLKVIDKGGKVYCSGDVHLYHLERLSQNLVAEGDWKWKLSMANGAYQELKWGRLIDEKFDGEFA